MIAFTGIDPRLRERAELTVLYAQRLGIPVEVTSVRRTEGEQRKLYAKFQAGKAKYPTAPPGTSAHQFGVAWDSVVPERWLPTWTAIRRAMGWKVSESDIIHAEAPNWRAARPWLQYS